LRRHRPDDLDAVFQAVTESLDHLRPWMPWAANYTRESAAGFLAKSARDWADGTEYGYAIITGRVLAGGCGLMSRIGPGGLEIGYWVHRAWTRRGLATAASAALVEAAFRLPGVDRIEIVHDELTVRLVHRLTLQSHGDRVAGLPRAAPVPCSGYHIRHAGHAALSAPRQTECPSVYHRTIL
jgi:Acetyltransferase (GNAT) domain